MITSLTSILEQMNSNWESFMLFEVPQMMLRLSDKNSKKINLN